MKWLKGRKTYIIAILMVVVSLIHVVSGDITIAQFFQSEDLTTLLQAFGLAALRNGIS